MKQESVQSAKTEENKRKQLINKFQGSLDGITTQLGKYNFDFFTWAYGLSSYGDFMVLFIILLHTTIIAILKSKLHIGHFLVVSLWDPELSH